MLSSKKIDVNSLTSLTRSIWLAGLGAYAKTNEKVIDSADKAYESANETFQQLLSRGESMQEEANTKAKTELDTRVNQLKDRLGLTESDSEQKLTALSNRVELLAEAVAALIEQKAQAADETVTEAPAIASADTSTTASEASQMPLIDDAAKSEVEASAETADSATPEVVANKPAASRPTTRRGRRSSKAASPKA